MQKRKSLYLIVIGALLLLVAVPALANGDNVTLPNPIKCETLPCLFLGAIRFLLAGLAIFGTFMFMYGGYLWLTSAGNEKRVQSGKDTLVWATLGLVIILISWQVIKYVLTVLVESGGT